MNINLSRESFQARRGQPATSGTQGSVSSTKKQAVKRYSEIQKH